MRPLQFMDTIANAKLKLKKKKLYDEYDITNKNIICKFKYLLVCFDTPEDNTLSGGLINLDKNRIIELFDEQNIIIDSTTKNTYFYQIMTQLKEWHPLIHKLEVDCKNIYELDNLDDYQSSLEQIYVHLNELPKNNCVHTQTDHEIYNKISHKVIDIKVYFQLVKKIVKIEDYNVNLRYLQKLLISHIMQWNLSDPPYLDEVSVDHSQLPYAHKLNYLNDDNGICYVYPTMHLIPLNSVL